MEDTLDNWGRHMKTHHATADIILEGSSSGYRHVGNLFQGGWRVAQDVETLRRLGIVAIVNCTHDITPPDDVLQECEFMRFVVSSLTMGRPSGLLERFKDVFSFVEQHLVPASPRWACCSTFTTSSRRSRSQDKSLMLRFPTRA